MLFDPDNLASRLCPRPQTLRRLIDLLNDDQLQEAWQPGSEETIGWVYQALNAEELEQAFRKVPLTKKKFEASDIPSVTQLFTPRWIVRFLVENTVGRLWIRHPTVPQIYLSNSTVVICHAGTPMLPLGQTEYPDQDKGVCDGTADY